MDFMERLCEEVNKFPEMPILCKMGYLGSGESFVVFPLPGSTAVRTFMDGAKEVALNYEFAMKSKEQSKIHATLWKVQDGLSRIENIISADYSFEFEGITVTNKPFISQLDEQGWFVFLLDIKANIIVFNDKEEINNG